jgi:hypothetical protein
MTTYEEFQSSTKIISQENLIYVGEIFITVHIAAIKQICRILVLHKSQHTKHHKQQYKKWSQQHIYIKQ